MWLSNDTCNLVIGSKDKLKPNTCTYMQSWSHKYGWHINQVVISQCRHADNGLHSQMSHAHIFMRENQNIEGLRMPNMLKEPIKYKELPLLVATLKNIC